MSRLPWYRQRKYRLKANTSWINSLLGIEARYVNDYGVMDNDLELVKVLTFSSNGNMPLKAGEISDLWAMHDEPGYYFPFDDPHVHLNPDRVLDLMKF